MITGYIVETGQGVFGPFLPDQKTGMGAAIAAAHLFIERHFNRLEQPVVIKPLLDPTKLPRA